MKSTGPHANAETILLIGSTSRCALNGKQAVAFGTCASTGAAWGRHRYHRGQQRRDHAAPHGPGTRAAYRSSRFPATWSSTTCARTNFHKVDAALAYGPSQLVALIEQDLGIPVNHFVELNFDTFQSVVNTLGGVKVYFPDRVLDTSPDSISPLPAATSSTASRRSRWCGLGTCTTGSTASRSTTAAATSVGSRACHEFLRILASAVAARGLGNPIADNDLLGEIAPELKLDSTFTLRNMVDLVLDFHSVNPAKAPETTLPNIEYYTDYMYEGYDYGSVVLPSYPKDQQAIDNSSASRARRRRRSHRRRSRSAWSTGLATRQQQPRRLPSSGLSDTGSWASGTWPAVGPLSETVVEYSPGHEADAERVMRSLSGIVSMTEAPVRPPPGSDVPSSTGADVTVITGTNFSVVAALRRRLEWLRYEDEVQDRSKGALDHDLVRFERG